MSYQRSYLLFVLGLIVLNSVAVGCVIQALLNSSVDSDMVPTALIVLIANLGFVILNTIRIGRAIILFTKQPDPAPDPKAS